MKYLVTGGAGFIGSHLVEELLKLNHEVVVVDDLSTGNLQNLENHDQCRIFTKKIQDLESGCIADVNGIFHLAAQASVPLSIDDFYKSCENNLLSSLKVLDFAKILKVPVVYASSSAIYGELPEGDDTTEAIDLGSPYAVDKFTLEKYAEIAHRLYGIPSIGLRFFNIYGPRQDPNNPYSGVIPIFICNVAKEEEVTVNGGHQTRDFVFVRDAVRIICKSMDILGKSNVCERVNVCTGESISIDSLLGNIVEILGKKPKVKYEKLPPGDPEKSLGNYGKMLDFLGIELGQFTQLKAGIEETIQFFQRGNNEI